MQRKGSEQWGEEATGLTQALGWLRSDGPLTGRPQEQAKLKELQRWKRVWQKELQRWRKEAHQWKRVWWP